MARLLTLLLTAVLAPSAVLARTGPAQRSFLGSIGTGTDAAPPPVNYNVAAGSFIELFLSALGAKGHALFDNLVFDRIKARRDAT